MGLGRVGSRGIVATVLLCMKGGNKGKGQKTILVEVGNAERGCEDPPTTDHPPLSFLCVLGIYSKFNCRMH